MAKVSLNGKGETIKLKSRNPVIEFDKAQLYFGHPYKVVSDNSTITINQPKIGKIVDFGVNEFYSSLNIFTTNTTSFRLLLWKNGMDWNEISDFDLFMMLYRKINQDCSDLIFDNIIWGEFEIREKEKDGEIKRILYNPNTNVEIDEWIYFHISQYLRTIFNIHPEEKLTKDRTMKQWFINKDKRELANREEMDTHKDASSSLLATISACINHPGFKYNLQELENIGVYQFYDSANRLQIYENSTAVLKGMYSGFVSSKDIKPSDYNFMKEIEN